MTKKKINMQVKKRTMNELRQTKDCHYVSPRYELKNMSNRILDEYYSTQNPRSKDKLELNSFIHFLQVNDYKIVKH